MKKFITILLFLTFGFVGAHRFYLGFMKSGLSYFILWTSLFTSIVLKHENIGVLIFILILLYWIYDLVYFTFKYNYKATTNQKPKNIIKENSELVSDEEIAQNETVNITQVDDNTFKVGNLQISLSANNSLEVKKIEQNLINTEYFQRSLNFSKSILIKSKKDEIDSLIFLCGVSLLYRELQNNFLDQNDLKLINLLANQRQIIFDKISEYSGSQKFKLDSSFQEILKYLMKEDFEFFLKVLKKSVFDEYSADKFIDKNDSDKNIPTSLAEEKFSLIINDYQNQCKKAYKNLSSSFSLNQPTISEEGFKNLSAIYQINMEDAYLLANKIRQSKIIPCFLPRELFQIFDEKSNSEVFRKGWWLSPLSTVGFQYYSPLLLGQSGIYALTELGSNKFELICNIDSFPNYIFSDQDLSTLTSELHKNGIISASNENHESSWKTIFFHNQNEENTKNFNIYSEKSYDFISLYNLVVFSAMLDVWSPVVNVSRNLTAFHFSEKMFRDFESMKEIVEWARNEMTMDEIEHSSHFDVNLKEFIDENKISSESKITDNQYFLSALEFAKGIAIKSKRTEIDQLVFLCGVYLSSEKENYIKFTGPNIKFLRQKAIDNQLSIDIDTGYSGELKFKLEKSFYNVVKKHIRGDFSDLVSDILKNLKQSE